jgi:hypothetical protein
MVTLAERQDDKPVIGTGVPTAGCRSFAFRVKRRLADAMFFLLAVRLASVWSPSHRPGWECASRPNRVKIAP